MTCGCKSRERIKLVLVSPIFCCCVWDSIAKNFTVKDIKDQSTCASLIFREEKTLQKFKIGKLCRSMFLILLQLFNEKLASGDNKTTYSWKSGYWKQKYERC